MPASYRIPRHTTTARVRLHPSLEWSTLSYKDDPHAALRALVHQRAPSLLGRVPLTLHTFWHEGTEVGGPGVALRRLEEQLMRDAQWERR